jgi:hypothetical protein
MNFPLGFLHFFRLPCALGEFRSTGRESLAARIVGFAEHITSHSARGDFFGLILDGRDGFFAM